MATAGYAGPCGTDKRWTRSTTSRCCTATSPGAVEPALADSRVFQRLLDEALEAWTRDGGWAAFTADALAALQDVVERLPKGRRGRRELRVV